jgi:hypothetical protein
MKTVYALFAIYMDVTYSVVVGHEADKLFLWQAFNNSKPGEVDIDTKSQSLASLEADVQLKKLGHIPARNFMELDYCSRLDDSPSCWLNRSQEVVPSNSYSPISDVVTCLKYEIREPGYEFGGRNPVVCADSDSAYGFPSKRYGSFACDLLKELDEVHDPNELFLWQAFKNSKPGEVDIDTKSQSLVSLESDIQLKKLGYIPARNSMELDYGSHLDDSPSCWLNRSQEAVLSNSYSPIGDAIAYLKYEIREPGYQFGGRTPFLCADSDSAYGFPSKRYGSFACNRLKELCELHDPNEYSIQREQHALLLGWDFDEGTDKRNLSNICQNTELSVYSPSSSSRGDEHQHILDDRFGENEFSKSSFLSICSPKVIPLPRSQSPSASYTDHDFDFERLVTGDKEDIYTDVNHFPLALSLAPDYLNLAEDCKNDTECKDNSIFRAPQNLYNMMSKVFSKTYHCPGVEGSLFSSALGLTGSSREHYSPFNYALQTPRNEGTSSHFLLKDKNESCLDGLSHRETPSYIDEDIVDIQDCSSYYFQIPLDKEKACPLLLNQLSWDGT